MNKNYNFVGEKYTLHIKDCTDSGGKCIIRFSENELTNIIGVPFLARPLFFVDELVELIKLNDH